MHCRHFKKHLLFWDRKKQFKLRLKRNKLCKIKLLTMHWHPPGSRDGREKGEQLFCLQPSLKETSEMCNFLHYIPFRPSDLKSCTRSYSVGREVEAQTQPQ